MKEVALLATDPIKDLHPTARLIVETTRRLLVNHGYDSLTLERIARECGLNKAVIPYYFGNKAGLMEVVVDAWVHDNFVALSPTIGGSADSGWLHRFLRAKLEMSENTELYLAFYELLPAMLRDPEYSGRVTQLYEWLIGAYAALFEVDLKGLPPDDVRAFAQLLIAVVDGLGVQHAIDGRRLGAEGAFSMLERILGSWIDARRAALRTQPT